MAVDVDKKIETLVSNMMDDMVEHAYIDRDAVKNIIHDVRRLIFPSYFGYKNLSKYELGGLAEKVYTALVEQTTHALRYDAAFADTTEDIRREKAEKLIGQFLDKLTTVSEYLKTDIDAAFDGDPAAVSKDEIVYSYPGFYAITVNRVAHELYLLGIPLIPRIMTEVAHGKTGIDIHPGATIGKYFFIDHGTGVVIGETTEIGDRVKIYQGVTLGALSTRAGQNLRGKKRHPSLGNDVTIYSNASVLGGNTFIGDDTVIGGSCFITSSIPAHMRVSNQSAELCFTTADGIPKDPDDFELV